MEAFRKTKAALGVQLAEELFTGFGLRVQASEECVDVFVDGFAIRLYLHSQRSAFPFESVAFGAMVFWW